MEWSLDSSVRDKLIRREIDCAFSRKIQKTIAIRDRQDRSGLAGRVVSDNCDRFVSGLFIDRDRVERKLNVR